MTILIILTSLILTCLVVMAVFSVMLYTKLTALLVINGAYQAEEYRQAVAVPKHAKPKLPVVKQDRRGREIEKQDDLVDMADIPWEEGYKAVEDLNNG